MSKLLILLSLLFTCSAAYSQAPGPDVKKKATATIPVATQCYQSNLKKGKKQYIEGQYDKAKETFQKALVCDDAGNGNDAQNWIAKCDQGIRIKCKQSAMEKGKSLYETGDYENAKLMFSKAAECSGQVDDIEAGDMIVKCNSKIAQQKDFNEIEQNMVLLHAGTFYMGSPASEAYRSKDEDNHQVSLSTFKMSKYEVTFKQYDAFCEVSGLQKPDDNGWGRGNSPVINVSWFDASAYCEWLSKQAGIDYRLPTEAEWEYASRAGTTTPFNTGKYISTSQANFNTETYGTYPYVSNSDEAVYRHRTLPVGSFPPNAW
jgi:formylglycine-generating enzyme required for sulfatase activity